MSKALNAIELLKSDHEAVKALLEKLVATSERGVKTRRELLEKIEKELLTHTQLEEQIFYPAFKEASSKEGGKIFYEAKEEHRAVEQLVLPDLKKTDPSTLEFSGRAKVLKELVEHHAEEEEKEMFAMAKKNMSKEELQALGERMQKRKSELGKSR